MTRYEGVPELPDLIDAAEYDQHPDGGLIRLRISVTPSGVEILGDGMRPEALEALLESLEPDEIEQMWCG
ncbi:radical SAM-modified peptide, FtsH ternary system-associated [Actinoplanes sp. NPDC049118]|uniref:radical SAM-modified peptide, FtsH ternary system-associated n=1 Tax=Actinoplanes sp. NPDC049118 TaxID=3155769 RepID=UPI0034052715